MPVNQMYHTWFQWLRQLWPQAHIPRWRNAAWFMTSLQDSHSVQLQRIAGKIPGSAKLLSRVRRLERFLANPRLRVRPSYEPVARALLDHLAGTLGEIRLIADGTQVSAHHQLLLISVAYRRRAIPLAWTWIRECQGS